MRQARLVNQSLRYHWRTNLAVMLGVAVAVAVLAGALIVGDSVRASLRDLFLLRLGHADYAVSAPDFFREQLAADLQNHTTFSSEGFLTTAPLIELTGSVGHATSG